ncbi:uroporphyrinogen-III synthase, partial [Brevundimonas diminuta]
PLIPRFRRHPVFAVGDATAEAARAAGFADVRSAAGDIHALARLIAAEAPPGPL